MKISACIIAKNEEQNLGHCLASLTGNVDELIVVDTGSTDNTVQVALSFKARVFDYEWENDFSKARNYAISKATGDWIVFLDADEYLTNDTRDQLVTVIKEAHRKKAEAIFCMLTNLDKDGLKINSFPVVRMFKKSPQIHYSGAIHEKVVHKHRPLQAVNVLDKLKINHTGYSSGEIDRKNKSKRNLDLLFQQLEEQPESSDLCFYISESYMLDKDYRNALIYAEKAVHYDNANGFGVMGKNYLNMIIMQIHLGASWEQLVKVIDEAIAKFPQLPDFHVYKADYYRNKNYDYDAIRSLETVIANLQHAFGSQSFVHHNLDVIYEKLGALYVKTGQLHKGITSYIESLKFNRYHFHTLKELVKVLSKHESHTAIANFLKQIYADKQAKDQVYLFKAALFAQNLRLAEHYLVNLDEAVIAELSTELASLQLLRGAYKDAFEKYRELYAEGNEEIGVKCITAYMLAEHRPLRIIEHADKLSLSEAVGTAINNDASYIDVDRVLFMDILNELARLHLTKTISDAWETVKEHDLHHPVAELCYQTENYAMALNHYDAFLQAESEPEIATLADVLYKMACCLAAVGERAQAMAFLKDVIVIDPKHVEGCQFGLQLAMEAKDSEGVNFFVAHGREHFRDSDALSNSPIV